MNKGIQIHQRVQLAGSKLVGTTVSVSEVKSGSFVIERDFQVKWDTGSIGTVKEKDLELHVPRHFKHQAA